MEKRINAYGLFCETRLKEVLIDNLQPKKLRKAKNKKILAEAGMDHMAHIANQPWFWLGSAVTELLTAHLQVDPTWNYLERWLDNTEFSSITVTNSHTITVTGSLWWGYRENIGGVQIPEAIEAEFVLAEEHLSYSIKLYTDGLCRHISNAGVTQVLIESPVVSEPDIATLLASLKNKGQNAPQKSLALHIYLSAIQHNINYLTAYTIAQSGKRGIEALLTLLEDKDIELQSAAVYALGLIGEDATGAIPTILAVLPDARQQLRCLAAVAICHILSDRADTLALLMNLVPDLLKALNEQNYEDEHLSRDTANFARKILTKLARQDQSLLALLIQAFENGEVPSTLGRIFYDLGSTAKEAIPALVKAMNDSGNKNRRIAAYALSHMGIEGIQIIAEKLKDEDIGVQNMAAFIIEEAANEGLDDLKTVIPELIQALEKGEEARFCCAIALSLARIDLQDPRIIETLNSVAPNLIQAIQHPDSFTAGRAIEALGLVRAHIEQVVPILIAGLKDPEKDVIWRKSALKAFCTIGVDTGTITLLLTEILREKGIICGDTIDILIASGSPEALAALFFTMSETLKAKNKLGFSHYKAFQVLQKIGPASIPLLGDLLQDKARHIRIGAARTLGRLGKPAVPYLIQVLTGSDIRPTAAEALGEIGSEATAAIASLEDALSDADLNTIARAIEALGRIGKPAVPALIRALQGEDAFAAMWAAAILGRMGKDAGEAVPFLMEALHHDDAQVRELAAKALHQQGENAAP